MGQVDLLLPRLLQQHVDPALVALQPQDERPSSLSRSAVRAGSGSSNASVSVSVPSPRIIAASPLAAQRPRPGRRDHAQAPPPDARATGGAQGHRIGRRGIDGPSMPPRRFEPAGRFGADRTTDLRHLPHLLHPAVAVQRQVAAGGQRAGGWPDRRCCRSTPPWTSRPTPERRRKPIDPRMTDSMTVGDRVAGAIGVDRAIDRHGRVIPHGMSNQRPEIGREIRLQVAGSAFDQPAVLVGCPPEIGRGPAGA